MPPGKKKDGPSKPEPTEPADPTEPAEPTEPAAPAEPHDATKLADAAPPAKQNARSNARSKSKVSKLPQVKNVVDKAAKKIGMESLDTGRELKKNSGGKYHSNSSAFAQGFRRSLEVWMREHYPEEVRENKWAINKGKQNVIQRPNAAKFGPSLLQYLGWLDSLQKRNEKCANNTVVKRNWIKFCEESQNEEMVRSWKEFARDLRTADGFHRFRPDLDIMGGTLAKSSRMRGLIVFLGQTDSQNMERAGEGSDEEDAMLEQEHDRKRQPKKRKGFGEESEEDVPRKKVAKARASKKRKVSDDAPEDEPEDAPEDEPEDDTGGYISPTSESSRKAGNNYTEEDVEQATITCKFQEFDISYFILTPGLITVPPGHKPGDPDIASQVSREQYDHESQRNPSDYDSNTEEYHQRYNAHSFNLDEDDPGSFDIDEYLNTCMDDSEADNNMKTPRVEGAAERDRDASDAAQAEDTDHEPLDSREQN